MGAKATLYQGLVHSERWTSAECGCATPTLTA